MICLNSFPSQVQLLSDPGLSYPARLRRNSPSGPHTRAQSPQWPGMEMASLGGSACNFCPSCPPWQENGAPGNCSGRNAPRLPSALSFPLFDHFDLHQLLALVSPAPTPGTLYPRMWLIPSRAPVGRHRKKSLNHRPKSGTFVAPSFTCIARTVSFVIYLNDVKIRQGKKIL